MKTLLYSSLILTSLCSPLACGAPLDLLQSYLLAEQHDATLQSAKQTYLAARLNAPIAFAALLPQVAISGNTKWTKPTNPSAPGSNSHGYSLSLSQSVFNLSNWFTFDQALSQLKIDAMTYATASQNLITTVAQNYFAILNANENLRYAKANVASLKQQLKQSVQRHEVGLVPITDVQSARASYESAIAIEVANENALKNSKQQLAVNIGQPVDQVVPLSPDFPLLTPQPSNPQAWVKLAEKQNLSLLSAQKQVDYDRAGLKIDWSQYLPTVSANLSMSHSVSSGAKTNSRSAGLNANYTPFSGGSTYYTHKKDTFTLKSDQLLLLNTQRTVASQMRQAYSTILSDISQIKAYKQSVVSGEAAFSANKAAYNAGTKTIVDVLTQQSDLFKSQQNYANATFTYITDTLKLKQNAGDLNINDIRNINTWLGSQKPTNKA